MSKTSCVSKKSLKKKVPTNDVNDAKNSVMEEPEIPPYQNIFLIEKSSNEILPAQQFGEPPNVPEPVYMSLCKEEDIETECEDTDSSDMYDHNPSKTSADDDISTKSIELNNLQNSFIKCHVNVLNNSKSLETISNVHNIKIEEEPKNPGCKKYVTDINKTISNCNSQYEPTPTDLSHPSLHLERGLDQGSAPLTPIFIKKELFSNNGSIARTFENHTFNPGCSTIISDEIVSKVTDKLILGAMTGVDHVVHIKKEDVIKSDSLEIFSVKQRTTKETASNIDEESKQITKRIKTKSADVEIHKCGEKSTNKVKNSSNCTSVDDEHSSSSASEISESFSDNEGCMFSMNSIKYLYLNIDFDKQNLRECLNLISKHRKTDSSELFHHMETQYKKTLKSPVSGGSKNVSNEFIDNYSSVETPSSEVDSKILIVQEVNPDIQTTSPNDNCSLVLKPTKEIYKKIPTVKKVKCSDIHVTSSDNCFYVQKPEIERNKNMEIVQELNCSYIHTTTSFNSTRGITPTQIHSVTQSPNLSALSVFTTDYLQHIKKPTCCSYSSQTDNELTHVSSNIYAAKEHNTQKLHKCMNYDQSVKDDIPLQHSEQTYFKNPNLIYIKTNNLCDSEKGNIACSTPTLPNSQIQRLENICQKGDVMLNSSTSVVKHNKNQFVLRGTNTLEMSFDSEPPWKKMKLVHNTSCQPSACNDQIDNPKHNGTSFFEAVSLQSSASGLNMKQNIGDPKEIISEEYIHCKVSDPRLKRVLTSSASAITLPLTAKGHVSTPSFATQVLTTAHASSTTPTSYIIVKSSRQHDPRKSASQLHLASVSSEITSIQGQKSSRNLDHPSRQSSNRFRPKARKCDSTVNKDTTTKNLFVHIIGWKTRWLGIQKNAGMCPRHIGKCKKVENSYQGFAEYQDTYHHLHLLNIWLCMYKSWRKNPPSYRAHLKDYQKHDHYYKNTCIAVMPSEDIPIHQGVIQVMYTNIDEKPKCRFGYVYDVWARDTNPPPDMVPHRSNSWKEVIFSFYTINKLDIIKMKGIAEICKLCKIRVAIKQCDALGAMESHPMREIIFNPDKHSLEISLVRFPTTFSQLVMQTYIDKIIQCATSAENKFTLVVRESSVDSLLPILKIVRGLLVRRSSILICLRDINMFFRLADLLNSPGSPEIVLGVKESEVSVPVILQDFTLRSHATKLPKMSLQEAELEVLNNSKIILTILSSIFLSDNRNAILGKDLTCIIEDAHLSTEAETALPLSYKPNNVVLLGNPYVYMEMDPFLKDFGYHTSLFHRLFKVKENEIKKL